MRKSIVLSIMLTAITLLLLFNCSNPLKQSNTEDNEPVHEVYEEPLVQTEYGIAIDSFNIIDGRVKRNQVLSQILGEYGITAQDIDQIARKKDIFDVRKIKSGNKYKLFTTKDSMNTLSYFVYEHTLTEYLVIKFADSIEFITGEKPTEIRKQIASGTISSNLWDAMVENNINPIMSIELSEIYAWSIDFFGLKKGDNFYVIYEERFLDTVSVGIEYIEAALFNHQNKDFYAISFVQDDKSSYFDEKGGSLRRAFLKAPLKYSRISSPFTHSRFHPILKIYRPHHGVDYAAPAGTPVYSVGDGFILKKGYQKKGAGNYVKIKHNSVYTTQYAHLKSFAKGLKNGAHVKQGQLIGYVGSTGYATGPHLDFRFFKNGKPVNPLKVEAPPVEPIKKVNKEEFERIKKQYIEELNKQRKSYKSNPNDPIPTV